MASGGLSDWISLGVLTSFVSRDAVDEAIEATGKGARRAGGKIPPRVAVYFVMALALFADADYEEVAARLAGTLADWGGVAGWGPTSGGLTQARQRLGSAPLAELFAQVARPVADLETVGAFLSAWRLMSIDGLEFDVPASKENTAAFGLPSAGDGVPGAFPKVRAVTVTESGSHAPVLAALGAAGAGKAVGEQTLARTLYPRLETDWLLLADRNFYNWVDWCTAADTGAALLWRVKANLRLPPLRALPDGSYLSVLISPKVTGRARDTLVAAARAGEPLDPARARLVRVVEYDVPDRDGDGKHELIALITTILDPGDVGATALARAYHQRWEHETANKQVKTYLRGPGKVLRSKSPDTVYQEIWGYLLTHHAISALICTAATAAGIDPDRVRFTRTVRLLRRQVADPPAFPP
jgi:Insertion element 4 transposase N-terminal